MSSGGGSPKIEPVSTDSERAPDGLVQQMFSVIASQGDKLGALTTEVAQMKAGQRALSETFRDGLLSLRDIMREDNEANRRRDDEHNEANRRRDDEHHEIARRWQGENSGAYRKMNDGIHDLSAETSSMNTTMTDMLAINKESFEAEKAERAERKIRDAREADAKSTREVAAAAAQATATAASAGLELEREKLQIEGAKLKLESQRLDLQNKGSKVESAGLLRQHGVKFVGAFLGLLIVALGVWWGVS